MSPEIWHAIVTTNTVFQFYSLGRKMGWNREDHMKVNTVRFVRSSKMLVSNYGSIQHHNPQAHHQGEQNSDNTVCEMATYICSLM